MSEDIQKHNKITVGSAAKGACIQMYFDLEDTTEIIQTRIDKFHKVIAYVEKVFGVIVR